jgi:hypothetical protein
MRLLSDRTINPIHRYINHEITLVEFRDWMVELFMDETASDDDEWIAIELHAMYACYIYGASEEHFRSELLDFLTNSPRPAGTLNPNTLMSLSITSGCPND